MNLLAGQFPLELEIVLIYYGEMGESYMQPEVCMYQDEMK